MKNAPAMDAGAEFGASRLARRLQGESGHGRGELKDRIRRTRSAIALFIGSSGAMAGVNRIYGHDAGDRMLDGMIDRLLAVAPETAFVTRLAGAKIAILATVGEPEAAADMARVFVDAMAAAPSGPSVDPRIGVAWAPFVAPGGGEALIAAALGALDRARHSGSEIEIAILDREAERDEIARARYALDMIRSGGASIALQPVVAADTPARFIFREALIWVSNPDGSPVPAQEFMPQLDRLGMTEDVDIAALELAFDELENDPSARISVNLSGAAITRRRWPDCFCDLAAARPDCAARLIVEVTEEAAISRASAARALFALIRSHGTALALDDFGAGRTSFRHLRDFRFDIVKIDGGFIRGVDKSPDNQMLVSALVAIAKQFDMMVIAEFVENAAEARVLRGLGVDGFQGFFFGRPVLVWSDGVVPGQGATGQA